MARTFTDASSDRIHLGAFMFANGPLTWMFWVYRTGTPGGNRTLFSDGSNPSTTSNGNKVIRLQSANTLRFFVNRVTTDTDYVTSTTLTLNTWECVFADYDEAATPEINIYIGNATTPAALASFGTNTDGSGSDASLADYAILGQAAHTTTNSAPPIRLGMFAAWNRILTAHERYAAQFLGILPSSGLQAWIIPGSGSTEPDYSGQGHTGTVTGTSVSDGPPIRAPFAWACPEGDEYAVAAAAAGNPWFYYAQS